MEKTIDNIITLLNETKETFSKSTLKGDLSDIGNVIGIAIQKAINENPNKNGFELDDFHAGLEHGISLEDGTHP